MSETAKYLINKPQDFVRESLQGLCAIHSYLSIDATNKVVYCKDIDQIKESQVTLISGGGSGHEPSHAGFVGQGMLTAAVAGHVFASPSSSQILSALRRCASSRHGSLVIVKNYTGDVINFGRAIERARWEGLAKDFKMVVVADDVGVVTNQKLTNNDTNEVSDVGRRGLAGTVLVHKVAGAAAALGGSLEEVYRAAQTVTQNIATIGVALSTCTVPGSTVETRQMGSKEVEFGLGIHGEPGFEIKKLESSQKTVQQMLDKILNSPEMRLKLGARPSSYSAVLLVNNLGGTTSLELYTTARDALLYLRDRHVHVLKTYAGTLMTSLDMHGISLTLLAVPPGRERQMLKYLDHPLTVPGWVPSMGDGLDLDALLVPSPQTSADKGNRGRRVSTGNAAVNGPDSYLSHQWKPAIIKACKAVITAEPTITHYDTVWGDADCGLTLKSGANAVLSGFDNQSNNLIPLDPQQPDLTMAAISELVEDSMGGTSGGIYCIMLDALAAQLQSIREEIPNDQGPTLKQWATSLEAALETLEQYTTARVGHRTLMDALTPFIQSLLAAASDDQASPRASLVKAVDAAYQGMEGTKKMVPRRGRATYIGGQDESDTDKYEMPDPGAYGLYTLLKGLLDASKA